MSPVVSAERACEVCGVSIEHLRPQASTCSDACRQAKRRGRARPPAVVAPPPQPTCPHPTALPDEDGDPVCVLCGSLIGAPSRPNGHEAVLALMVTDADGQYRRFPRRREPHRWRDWQPDDAPVRITGEVAP